MFDHNVGQHGCFCKIQCSTEVLANIVVEHCDGAGLYVQQACWPTLMLSNIAHCAMLASKYRYTDEHWVEHWTCMLRNLSQVKLNLTCVINRVHKHVHRLAASDVSSRHLLLLDAFTALGPLLGLLSSRVRHHDLVLRIEARMSVEPPEQRPHGLAYRLQRRRVEIRCDLQNMIALTVTGSLPVGLAT